MEITISNKDYFTLVESIIKDGHSVQIKIKGSSMAPYLKEKKDVVVVSPLKESIKIDHIALFKHKEVYALHRVIDIRGESVFLKGDSLNSLEKIDKSEIIGIVSLIIRNNKKLTGIRLILHKFLCQLKSLYPFK